MVPHTLPSIDRNKSPLPTFEVLQLLRIIRPFVNYVILPLLSYIYPFNATYLHTGSPFFSYGRFNSSTSLESGRGLNDFAFLHFRLFAILFPTFLFPSFPFSCLSLFNAHRQPFSNFAYSVLSCLPLCSYVNSAPSQPFLSLYPFRYCTQRSSYDQSLSFSTTLFSSLLTFTYYASLAINR